MRIIGCNFYVTIKSQEVMTLQQETEWILFYSAKCGKFPAVLVLFREFEVRCEDRSLQPLLEWIELRSTFLNIYLYSFVNSGAGT